MHVLFATSALVISVAVSTAGVTLDPGDPVHGNNPATDADNEVAFSLAVLWGMEVVEVVFPGITEEILGCNAPYLQTECEGAMWVPQGAFDQCISCYTGCYHNCQDCEWWIFCGDSCRDNLLNCSDGEIDL